MRGMKNDFGQLYPVVSLGTEWVLMIHTTSHEICQIFFLSHLYLEHGEMDEFP